MVENKSQSIQNSKNTKRWNWFIIKITLTFLSIVFFAFNPIGIVFFYLGYSNHTSDLIPFILLFTFLFMSFFLSIFFVIWAIVVLIKYLRYFKRDLLNKFVLLICVILIIAFCVLIHRSNTDLYLDGFALWTQEKIDVEQIRNWLNTLDPEIFTGRLYSLKETERYTKLTPVPVPDFIKKIDPPISYIRWLCTENEVQCVELVWGGTFGIWGLGIGPLSMEIPESTTDPVMIYKEVEEGVYIFSGD